MDDATQPADPGLRTLVILPTYNEKDTLVDLVEQILGVSGALEVLVVDDSSPDGTGSIADGLALKHPRVSVVHRERKLGLGSAYIAGFRRALAGDAARVVTMDADFSHHPRHLAAVIGLTEECDIGIGSRYVPGGGVASSWGWHRELLSRVANAFTRFALGFEVRDCTSGFRCYRRSVLELLDWGRIRSNGYSFLVETLYVGRSLGLSFGEAPIKFESRGHGTSKIGLWEIFKAVWTVVRLAGPSLLARARGTSAGWCRARAPRR